MCSITSNRDAITGDPEPMAIVIATATLYCSVFAPRPFIQQQIDSKQRSRCMFVVGSGGGAQWLAGLFAAGKPPFTSHRLNICLPAQRTTFVFRRPLRFLDQHSYAYISTTYVVLIPAMKFAEINLRQIQIQTRGVHNV